MSWDSDETAGLMRKNDRRSTPKWVEVVVVVQSISILFMAMALYHGNPVNPSNPQIMEQSHQSTLPQNQQSDARRPSSDLPQAITVPRLRDVWQTYQEPQIMDRWLGYAEHYELHLPKPVKGGATIKLLEIGIQSGGGARTWKQYYGDQLHYTGLDIDPLCRNRTESLRENMVVYTGSQKDPAVLLNICRERGPFHVIIDDGGHTADMINVSVNTMFPSPLCMEPRSVYVVEDVHTMERGSAFTKKREDIPSIFADAWLSMHWYWNLKTGQSPSSRSPIWKDAIQGVHLYDSIAFIIRGPFERLQRCVRGKDGIQTAVRTLHAFGCKQTTAPPLSVGITTGDDVIVMPKST